MGQSVQLSIVPNTLIEHFMDQQKRVNIKDLMKYEWMRFASFATFPLDTPIHTTRLAETGFYYQGQEDEVTCFSCGGKYKGWREGDVAIDIHRTISPNCPFINGNGAENVGIKQSPWNFVESRGDNSVSSNAIGNKSEEPTSQYRQTNQTHIATSTGSTIEQTTGACGGPLDVSNSNSYTRTSQLPRTTNRAGNSIGRQTAPNDLSGTSGTSVQNDDTNQVGYEGTTQNRQRNAISRNDRPETQIGNRTSGRNLSFVSQTPANIDTTITSANHFVDSLQPSTQTVKQNTARFQLEPLGVSFERPVYPQFAIISTRLSSYKNWPKHAKQRPEELSKSGLFHEGTGDRVRCFFCGGGLCNWDPEDDPWIEHARWYPRCVYVRQSKGDEFIYRIQEEVQKGKEDLSHLKDKENPNWSPTDQASASAKPSTTTDEDSMLSHPAALSVLDMGVNSDLVKTALRSLLTTNGRTNITAEHLLVKVWEIEDQSVAGNSKETSESNHGCDITGASKEENTNKTANNSAENTTTASQQGKSKKKTDDAERFAIMEENRHLRELQICKICLDEDVSIVFLPCGHMATCASCAPALRKCPICRTFIKGTVKAIIS